MTTTRPAARTGAIDEITVRLPVVRVRTLAADRTAQTVQRLRTITICAFLTGLAFIQQPGLVAEDTKIDLAINPVGWLARGLHMWNTHTNFGQIQNQEYGYFLPMGSFFALGHVLGAPAWVVQRLWWAVLLCVAFLGMLRLAKRMSIGTPNSQLIAAAAFALCPRILTEIGAVSAEAWPTAVAPWVLVPLIPLAKGGRILRGVVVSALMVALAGGVNATAVFAVALLPALWLMTLQPVRRRVVALGAWSVAVLMACAWWMAPLWLLGRYSPPFLDFIETAPVTTRVTDLVSIVRGTSTWLSYAHAWPTGRSFIFDGWLVAGSVAVAALGLTGLARKGMPHRHFLVAGLFLGVALVGMGHVATVDGLFADQVRGFLDGAGSPLRNVHKFDVVLRIPLLLGLAHLVGSFQRSGAMAGPGWSLQRRRATAITAATVGILAIAASPALAGNLPPTGGFAQVPGYWPEATRWLDDRLGDERALIVPAARFPNYKWGTPADEIVQPLMSDGWAVRSVIPLTPPATIRLLDSVEAVLVNGAGSAGLAQVLARSGVRYLVLRADLDYGKTHTTPPAIVQHAIDQSPGLVKVAEFGPTIGGGNVADYYMDHGIDAGTPAVQIYQVQRAADQVVAYGLSDVTTVVGGPESLMNLGAAGVLTDAPTVLAGDLPVGVTTGHGALTDDLRRRELSFGLLHDNTSATLSASDDWNLSGPAHDYLPAWAPGHLTTQIFYGIESVRASSAFSEAQPLLGSRPEHLPFAALDGDVFTSWRTPPNVIAAGQWFEINFDRPIQVPQVQVVFDTEADTLPTRITVTAGPESASASSYADRVTVKLTGSNVTNRLRITIDQALAVRQGQGAVGIAEVVIPGLNAQRSLLVPPPPAGSSVDSVVLTAAPATPACYFLDHVPHCTNDLRRNAEDGDNIDRTFTLPDGGSFRPTLEVKAKPGPPLNTLLDKEVAANAPLGLGPVVTTSSTWFDAPSARPGAAVDDDPTTAWFPSPEDTGPWMKLQWVAPRTVSGLKLTTNPAIAGARPYRLTVFGDGGTRYGSVDVNGVMTFDEPMTTDKLTILFREAPPAQSTNPYLGQTERLPIAVGEIQDLPRADNPPIDAGHVVKLPCGSGPNLVINGQTIQSSVTFTWAQLMREEPGTAHLCAPANANEFPSSISLASGTNRVIARGTLVSQPVRLSLEKVDPATGMPDVTFGGPTDITVTKWTGTDRSVMLPAQDEPQLLVMRENNSSGWRATLKGKQLAPIVVDGWQQGWVVPAGAGGEVHITFAPDRTYMAALILGTGLLGLLVVAAILLGARRHSRPARHVRRPDGARKPGGFLVVPLGAIALVSVGGYAGFAIGAFAATAAVIMFFQAAKVSVRSRGSIRRVLRAGWWLTPAACFAVAGYLWWSDLVALGRDPHTAAGPQVVALAGLGTVWVSTALGRRPFGKWLATLISGRSTK